jgi:hypothetical protein
MDEIASNPQDGSLPLIRAAMLGKSLSSAEWANVPTELLCAGAVLLLARFLELGLMAMDDRMRQTEEIEAEFTKLIGDKSRYLDEQLLEAIETFSRAVELLPEANLNRDASRMLGDQINLRAVDRSLSTVVMMTARFEPARSDFDASTIEQSLEIELLEDYRSSDDSKDLRQEAILGAVEKFDDIWNRGWIDAAAEAGSMRIAASGMFSPTLDSSRWNRAEIYRLAAVWLGSGLAPIFAEDPRALPRAARESYRNLWEQRDAKKRGGTGGRHAKAAKKME